MQIYCAHFSQAINALLGLISIDQALLSSSVVSKIIYFVSIMVLQTTFYRMPYIYLILTFMNGIKNCEHQEIDNVMSFTYCML